MSWKKDKILAIIMLIPSIIIIGVFVYCFIAWSIRVSLSNWKGILPNYDFVGLKNYISIFHNNRFVIDLSNNIFFTILFLGFCTIGGLFLAILLDQKLRGETFFRTIYLFPLSISFVVSGVVWRWIFSPKAGVNALLNIFLAKLGFENVNFQWGWYITTKSIGPFHIALVPIVIAASWQFMGYAMAMYLAGIRGIPNELREAARVDGASEFQVYSKVILPLLKPITFSALIILGHISLKIFDLVYVMTGRGPAFVTDFPSVFMYETVFKSNNYSEGAAIAFIMLLMVAFVIIPYLIIDFRKEIEV